MADRDDFDLDHAPSRAWMMRSAVVLAIMSALALIASFVLSVEAWILAGDQNSHFGCDVSDALSCSAVALTPQARVLGFPNAFFGIAFGAAVFTIACALLTGSRLSRLFLIGAEVLAAGGLASALWLFYQSYVVIQVLCPWCLVVFVSSLLIFATMTRICLVRETLPSSVSIRSLIASGTDWWITGGILVIIAARIVLKYGPELIA